jgi:hypothetical protein
MRMLPCLTNMTVAARLFASNAITDDKMDLKAASGLLKESACTRMQRLRVAGPPGPKFPRRRLIGATCLRTAQCIEPPCV